MPPTPQLQRHLEADSIGLLSTIAEIAEIIGLPAVEQATIRTLATGRATKPERA